MKLWVKQLGDVLSAGIVEPDTGNERETCEDANRLDEASGRAHATRTPGCSNAICGRKSTLRWWRRNGRDRGDPDPLPRLTHPVSIEHVLPIGKDHLTLNGRRGGY